MGLTSLSFDLSLGIGERLISGAQEGVLPKKSGGQICEVGQDVSLRPRFRRDRRRGLSI